MLSHLQQCAWLVQLVPDYSLPGTSGDPSAATPKGQTECQHGAVISLPLKTDNKQIHSKRMRYTEMIKSGNEGSTCNFPFNIFTWSIELTMTDMGWGELMHC